MLKQKQTFKGLLYLAVFLFVGFSFVACEKNNDELVATSSATENEVKADAFIQSSRQEVSSSLDVSASSLSSNVPSNFGIRIAENVGRSMSGYINVAPGKSYYVHVNGARLSPLYFYVKNESSPSILVEAYLGGPNYGSPRRSQQVSSREGSLFTFVGKSLNASYRSLVIKITNPGNQTVRNVKWNANFID